MTALEAARLLQDKPILILACPNCKAVNRCPWSLWQLRAPDVGPWCGSCFELYGELFCLEEVYPPKLPY